MQLARLALVCSVLIVAPGIRASPPIPDDLSLTVNVVSSDDPTLQPGAHAVLAFDVGQHGPTARDGMFFAIFNASTIPDGPDQPIRLSDAPGSACFLSPLDDGGAWFYSLTQSLPPIGEPIRCLVELDVLPGANGGYLPIGRWQDRSSWPFNVSSDRQYWQQRLPLVHRLLRGSNNRHSLFAA